MKLALDVPANGLDQLLTPQQAFTGIGRVLQLRFCVFRLLAEREGNAQA